MGQLFNETFWVLKKKEEINEKKTKSFQTCSLCSFEIIYSSHVYKN